MPGHGDGPRARRDREESECWSGSIIKQRHEVVAAVERLAVGVPYSRGACRLLPAGARQSRRRLCRALRRCRCRSPIRSGTRRPAIGRWAFPGREVDVARDVFRRAVGLLLRPGDVVDLHEHEAPLVQALQHGVELLDRGPELVVPPPCSGSPSKSAGSVRDERVEKDVRNGRGVGVAHGLRLLRLKSTQPAAAPAFSPPGKEARHGGDSLVARVILRIKVLRLPRAQCPAP